MPLYEGTPISIDPTRAAPNSGAIPVEPAPAMPAPAAPTQPSGGGFARPAPESGRTNAIEELYRMYQAEFNESSNCFLPERQKIPETPHLDLIIVFNQSKFIYGDCEIDFCENGFLNPVNWRYEFITNYLDLNDLKYKNDISPGNIPLVFDKYYYGNRGWCAIVVPLPTNHGEGKTEIIIKGPCNHCCYPGAKFLTYPVWEIVLERFSATKNKKQFLYELFGEKIFATRCEFCYNVSWPVDEYISPYDLIHGKKSVL